MPISLQNSLKYNSNIEVNSTEKDSKEELLTMPDDYSIEQIETGYNHSAAVVNDGTGREGDHLYMWGKNTFKNDYIPNPEIYGMLGLSKKQKHQKAYYCTPQEITKLPNGDIEQISLGVEHSSAVVSNNGVDKLYTWGDNAYSQLGVDDFDNTNYLDYIIPTEVKTVQTDTINDADWGEREKGPISTEILALDMGKDTGLMAAMDDEEHTRIYTWGSNYQGQQGLTDYSSDQKAELPEFSWDLQDSELEVSNYTIKDYSMGVTHSAAILTNPEEGTDHLYTFGNNEYGQLGFADSCNEPQIYNKNVDDENKNYENVCLPKEVTEGLPAGEMEQVATGNDTTAVIINGELYTWGINDQKQLGYEETNKTNSKGIKYQDEPKKVTNYPMEGEVEQVSLGWAKSSAIILKDDLGEEHLLTWGANEKGQLGIGNENTPAEPTEIILLEEGNIKQVSLGENFGMAIVNDGTTDYLYAWGSNEYGQLGVGNNTDYNTPQLVKYVKPSFNKWIFFYSIIGVFIIIIFEFLLVLFIYYKRSTKTVR